MPAHVLLVRRAAVKVVGVRVVHVCCLMPRWLSARCLCVMGESWANDKMRARPVFDPGRRKISMHGVPM